jgi:transposase-like protein
LLGEDWFDRLEAGVRQHIRSFIEAMLESELEAVLNCGRYERTGSFQGHWHGHRDRQILCTFGPITVSVPRAAGRGRQHDAGVMQPDAACLQAADQTGR